MDISSLRFDRCTHFSGLDGSTGSIVRTYANLLAELAKVLDISDLG